MIDMKNATDLATLAATIRAAGYGYLTRERDGVLLVTVSTRTGYGKVGQVSVVDGKPVTSGPKTAKLARILA